MWTFRRIFWFEQGELREIIEKLRSLRWNESICEFNVLATLVFGIPLAFFVSPWLGLFYVWSAKEALQALNMKHFFDTRPEALSHGP
jgi:hypothetical protein